MVAKLKLKNYVEPLAQGIQQSVYDFWNSCYDGDLDEDAISSDEFKDHIELTIDSWFTAIDVKAADYDHELKRSLEKLKERIDVLVDIADQVYVGLGNDDEPINRAQGDVVRAQARLLQKSFAYVGKTYFPNTSKSLFDHWREAKEFEAQLGDALEPIESENE